MMKDSRKLLILLGFICQGFTWDSYIVPAIFVLLWFICLKFSQKRKSPIPQAFEILIFALAFLICFRFGGRNLFDRSIAVGNALLVLQLLRLPFELDSRQKLLSVIIALIQVAIGSQILLGYGFLIILFAAIILIPKVLYELESGRFQSKSVPFFRAQGKKGIITIFVCMIIFFMVFPRKHLIGQGSLGAMIGRHGIMRPEMDMTGGGQANSDKLIFQIEGEDINYLKSFALDTYDNNHWTASELSFQRRRRFSPKGLEKCLYRRVTVRDLKLLGGVLPVDGFVMNLDGNFFQDPIRTAQGNVTVSMLWPKNNNYYEYWTDKDNHGYMDPRSFGRYTRHPATSPKVKAFLDKVIGNEKDPLKQAKALEMYLSNNFKYRLGAPNLNRLTPLEDFLFNQKEGHCERFASALTLLLRMKNIPSRVVVGYYVTDKNPFSDLYNVKSRNAHAWTEAFFNGHGWLRFDATPSEERSSNAGTDFTLSILDWFEFFWYSKIVNFSSSDQSFILKITGNSVKDFFMSLNKFSNLMLTILVVIVASITMFLLLKHFKFQKSKIAKKSKIISRQEASHFYGQMLKLLAKRNLNRESNQTPMEFINLLRQNKFEALTEAETITMIFCQIKYGNQLLSEENQKIVDSALKQLNAGIKSKTKP